MNILSIETSGRTFGLALWQDGAVIREVFENSGFIHSENLVPQIAKLLKSAGWDFKKIEKIAVSTGPGSFTGIRVGITCAKLLAQALDIPAAGIDTLSLLYSAVPDGDYCVIPAIDAGRGEVYAYLKNKNIEIVDAKKYFTGLRKLKNKIMITGNAAIVYRDVISEVLKKQALKTPEQYIFPRAGVLAALSDKIKGGSFEKVKPLYIRRSWAEEKAKKL